MGTDLERIRGELDKIDLRLVRALAERQQMIAEAAASKAATGASPRDPERERRLLGTLTEEGARQGLDPGYVTAVFHRILEQSVRHQTSHLVGLSDSETHGETLCVSYQGSAGAYSQIAGKRYFAERPGELQFIGFPSFRETLQAVQEGRARYAVLPVENSTAGSVTEAYDLLGRSLLSAVGEEVLRIEHCLLAIESVPIESIRRVVSHPQALAQCSEFIDSLPRCQAESYTDTAMAVERIVRERDLSQAAIASEEAAQLHGLTVIRRNLANVAENYTRFLVVAREPLKCDPCIPCKTSLMLATRHEHSALAACLQVLADHDLNLTKLESRPRRRAPWEYLFYLDFEGNVADDNVQTALTAVGARTRFLKVLGSYPAHAALTEGTKLKEPRPAKPVAEAMIEPSADDERAMIIAQLEKKPYKLASRSTRAEDTVVRIGEVAVGGPEPVLIGGPCSVESREQIHACAESVRRAGGTMLRGGCFKPRTSPYSFQGLGYDGLDLLVEAGRKYGLPIVTEVLHTSDVQRVAEHADVLQIGARNMQNFALLREVGLTQRPVLLKRGMMSSIDEWIAAAEYILAQGNQDVILCERGIRTFETATLGTLDLTAIPVVRERTHLPVIVDPSHAAGVRRWVAPLARAALAAGAQGVMVEMHPRPDEALSDGAQSLTVEGFQRLAAGLFSAPTASDDDAAEAVGE